MYYSIINGLENYEKDLKASQNANEAKFRSLRYVIIASFLYSFFIEFIVLTKHMIGNISSSWKLIWLYIFILIIVINMVLGKYYIW